MTWETFHIFWFLMGGVFLAALNGLKAFTEKKLKPEE